MKNINFLVFKNKILTDLLNEVKNFNFYNFIFSRHLDDLSYLGRINHDDENIILISDDLNTNLAKQLSVIQIPILYLSKKRKIPNLFGNYKNLVAEKITIPFKVNDLISKAQILLTRQKFLEKAFIPILNFKLDQNKREIIKENITLKLTEMEVNFLLFLKNANSPTGIQNILGNVWSYSSKTETHTVETHVHRLRKKFFDCFGETNIIKNNKKGYYI